jgi:hydroxyacylglutathione hydrolase
MNIRVIGIDTRTLGDRSYLIHDGHTAIVVDPQRDVDRIEKLLVREGVALAAVAETHLHNDYLTGGLELSRRHEIPYLVNKETEVAFERFPIKDQETFDVGDFSVKAISTPGHTFDHLAYLVIDSNGQMVCVATGGSLLHGSTGRPDLLGWEHATKLAGLQFDSAHRISAMVPDSASIYPTHGFGSFCSATPTLSDASSIGDEKRTNPVLIQDRAGYMREVMSNLDVYPKYFDVMAPANSRGPNPIDLADPPRLSSIEVERRSGSGTWTVDLRSRKSWSARHIKRSNNIGLDGSMASYVGWLLPPDQELILMSDEDADIAIATRELARIGIDNPSGAYVGTYSDFKNVFKIESVKFSDFTKYANSKPITILDVRQNLERQKSYIGESMHIPFYEVEKRMNEIPLADEIWVHCESGYRAATVLGVIEATGRTAVLIDDDFAEASKDLAIDVVYGEQSYT